MSATSKALVDLLADGLAELDLEIPEGAPRSLATLAGLVEEWGTRINLTGHRGAETIARQLIVGAGALLAQLPDFATLVDLGAGAGFPGLPIAILRPSAQVLLVEARERRHHFQRHAIRQLGLPNARSLRGRLEDLAPEPCDVVVAQAVATPTELGSLMLRWARPGGLLVVPGGASERAAPGLKAVEEARSVRYRVPLGGPERTLWIARRALPR